MTAESEEIRSRGQRLDGWKAIADYADRSERAVQRWSTQRGFPVHRIGGTGSVFAWTGEIDDWFNRQGADPISDREAPASSSTPGADPGLQTAPASGPASVPPSGPDAASTAAGTHSPDQPVLASPPPPVVIARMPWPQTLLIMVGAAVLGSAMTLGALRLSGLSGPVTGPPSPSASGEPCHAVDWPTQPLPARGGRVRVAVRHTSSPCQWVLPRTDSRWLLVVPPSELSAPARILLSPNHPLAMPPYDPSADRLTIEVAANHTTQARVAVLRFGSQEVRLTQSPGPAECALPPGPGFVADGWRYLLSRRTYDKDTNFLAAVRRDDTSAASPVTWDMLKGLLNGNELRGEQFADQVGLARHSWEEDDAASRCYNVWLTGEVPGRFINYFMNRRRLSYEERDQINNDQYDLGVFLWSGQVLYRVPAAAAAPSTPASGASRP